MAMGPAHCLGDGLTLKTGQLPLDHIPAFVQLSHKHMPAYSSESGKIHPDGSKDNLNSWIILFLFFACSFCSPCHVLFR